MARRGLVILVMLVGVSAAVIGATGASARTAATRTSDCGELTLSLAFDSGTVRVWTKGETCAAGKRFLKSAAVAKGLKRGYGAPVASFSAGRFNCGYEPADLMCWVGKPNKVDSDHTFGRAVARSKRAVLVTPIEAEVSAASNRMAAFKVIRMLAAHQHKKTSASLKNWTGSCTNNSVGIGGSVFLPGVRTWTCDLFDGKSPKCGDEVFVYRVPGGGGSAASRRWDAIGGTAPEVIC
jgi:hypothetical protein